MKPREIKAIQAKSQKLEARVLKRADNREPYTIIVGSSSTDTFNFIVTVKFVDNGSIHARCTCAWAEHGGIACCHVIAALSKLAALKHRTLSFWLTPEDARRQKQSLFTLRGGKDHIWITSRRNKEQPQQRVPKRPRFQTDYEFSRSLPV
jgi:hypothetical protein